MSVKAGLHFGYTVEPLLKDTSNKGHNGYDLSVKDKFCMWSLQDYGSLHNLKEDNLSITVKLHQN